jgi:predicted MFS family arabinose efflux permease
MDRDSVRRLRAQPGYQAFVGAATLARVSDEMFSVGVVLLVLDRTGSPGLAGATVAAITLPSVLTAPLLGAWLDVSGRRRVLMAIDQVIIAGVLVALALAIGNTPSWTIPAITVLAGLTYPVSFGGFTSLIPALVPEELLTPANALEASSFNVALVIGPALAGTLSAAVSPAAPLIVEAALALVALVLFMRIPGVDRFGGGQGRRFAGVVAEGLRQVVRIPQLRAVTAAGALGLSGFGLLTVAFPLFAVDHLDAARSDAGYIWAAFALGSTLGALGLVRIQRRFDPWWIVIGGLVGFGSLMLLWPLAGSLPAMLALVALAALADGPVLAATFAVRQRVVGEELYGQVFTTAAGIKVGSFSIGAALAGPAVSGLGSAETILLAAGVQFLGAGLGLLLMRFPARRSAAAAG